MGYECVQGSQSSRDFQREEILVRVMGEVLCMLPHVVRSVWVARFGEKAALGSRVLAGASRKSLSIGGWLEREGSSRETCVG